VKPPPGRVTWTGLNLWDVTRLFRDLVRRNDEGDGPWVWFEGRSRVDPRSNRVYIRIPGGDDRPLVAYGGDTIVRRADGSAVVEAGPVRTHGPAALPPEARPHG